MECVDEYKFSRKEPTREKMFCGTTGHKNCIILIFTLLCVMQGRERTLKRMNKGTCKRDQDVSHTQSSSPFISYLLFIDNGKQLRICLFPGSFSHRISTQFACRWQQFRDLTLMLQSKCNKITLIGCRKTRCLSAILLHNYAKKGKI